MSQKVCPICGAREFEDVMKRRQMPIYQNRLFDSAEGARNCEKRDLHMVMCTECGFVFNKEFDDSLELYEEDYNNSQTDSGLFREYMNSSIEYLKGKYDDNPKTVVEIGCGKEAYYLNMIANSLSGTHSIIGYDPSSDNNENEKLEIHPRYFDVKNETAVKADWLICRHVIEHISSPISLFQNVKSLNSENEKAVAFFETPDVRWILKNKIIFDFFYEHCSLFSPVSVNKMAEILDIEIDQTDNAFGGQYMWIFAQNRERTKKAEINLEEISDLVKDYREKEKLIFETINETLDAENDVILWGGGEGKHFFEFI